MTEKAPIQFTKYEEARILGARGLQIAMNAPLLIKISEEDLEKIKYDALKIAEVELRSGVLPISIKKPFPMKKEEKLKRSLGPRLSEKKQKQIENQEEGEITHEGEIMELVTTEEDSEEEAGY